MKTFTMPHTEITAPEVILGLMRIAEKSDEEIRTLVGTARDAGIDFFDHADVYGPELHACERRFADALALTPAERDQVTLQTKCGIVPDGPYFDFSYEHIVASAEESLRALKTDHIDILLLHRADALVEPEEVARAFDELHEAGKVRCFGVSNHTPRQIDLLASAVSQPLVANQLQLSITHSTIVAQGIAPNMQAEEQSRTLDGGGILDYCRLHGITVQAWSPFQAGFFNGVFLGDDRYPELNAVIDRLARELDTTPEAIAVAWIERIPGAVQTVLGTTTPSRVRDAAEGSGIELSRAQWYELFRAAGWTVP